ncbi:MAG: hypothetical protein AAFV98_10050 [Chloroflexota bacterium]
MTVLGRTLQRQDVIVSATVTFDSESDELELCSVGARQNFESDDSTTISQYIDVGFDNTGQAFVLANGNDGDGEVTIELDYEVDIDEPVAVLFILDDDTITVYMDGELVLERGEVFAEAGFFAVTVFAEDGGTSCEVSNMWVAELPGTEGDGCFASSISNVNQRTGPGTNFAADGQLGGGVPIEVIAQADGSDGFVWYQLDNENYVREDVVTISGFCDDLPEADD